jgi:ABC-type bacteriocin/lantibiotic exporter with double-glycine peptidase domain
VVPHFFQASEETCGAACLRMLFAALGVSAYDEATIAQHCGTTPAGCTVTDLVTGAKALGFQAAMLMVRDRSAALAALTNETPFVAMIDLGCLTSQGPPLQWHFVVPLALAHDVVTYITTRPKGRTAARRSTISWPPG